ncbi:MAG: PEGA domain-containing protein [Gammaproteobacteria bacterium]
MPQTTLRIVLASVISAWSLGMAGCASIVTGREQSMTFNSEPDGATVIVAGKTLGKTPITVKVPKDKHMSLTVQKEGYKPFTTQLSTTLEGWFWGNIVIGGLLGSTTDGISGAMYQYSPDQYFVTLVPDRPYGVSDVTRSRRIKELLVTFGHDIRMQLAAGNGEALDQVISLLDPDPEAKHRVTGVLRQFADETQDDLELARKAIDFYEPDRR